MIALNDTALAGYMTTDVLFIAAQNILLFTLLIISSRYQTFCKLTRLKKCPRQKFMWMAIRAKNIITTPYLA